MTESIRRKEEDLSDEHWAWEWQHPICKWRNLLFYILVTKEKAHLLEDPVSPKKREHLTQTFFWVGTPEVLVSMEEGDEISFVLDILWIVCDLNNFASFVLISSAFSLMGVSFVLSMWGLSRNESMSLFNFPNKAAEDENTDVVLDNVLRRSILLVWELSENEHGETEDGTRTTEKILCAPKCVSQSG